MSAENARILSGLLAVLSGLLLFRDLRRGKNNWGGFFGDRETKPGIYWFAVGMTALVFAVTSYRAVHGFSAE
jgi:hypothetical protein